ncbi:MAG TPA: NAD(P)-dependent oxidoreductase [Xanthobacteraceae bacterium]
MSVNIVTTHKIFPQTEAILRAAGTVHVPHGESFADAELATALANAVAVMAFMPDRVDTSFLRAAPRLSIVAGALKGYDNIDVEACSTRGVWVSIVPDLLTVPTAELAIGLLIGLARHLREADRYVRSGDFRSWTPRFYGVSVENSTVGIIGMGAVGCAVAKRLAAFDCRVVYFDKRPECAKITPSGEYRPLNALLAESDIVVLCIPLSAGMVHFINADRLALMKRGALLVNPARGSLIDEKAVATALAEGYLGGYAADAFELEDLSRADRSREIPPALLAHPHTLFSAHVGSATIAARQAIEARAAENILDALAGHAPRDVINTIARQTP